MENFKKILLIDVTLHKNNATAITLSNLFGSLPKENLFMIGSQEMVQLTKLEGYKNNYVLDDKDYYHKFPLGFFLNLRRKFSNKCSILKAKGSFEIGSNELKSVGLSKIFFSRSLFLLFFQRLGFDHLFFRQIICNELREWIKKSDPDYFYAVLSTRHSILFAEKLALEFSKPIVIHLMDDWPATIGNKSVFYRFWNRIINLELRRLLQVTHKRIAISELMAIEYSNRFGGDWLYFHNPVDVSLWRPKITSKISSVNDFRILYSGRLSTGVSETIKLVSDVVDNLNDTTNHKVSFQIQSNSKPGWIDKYRNSYFSYYISYNLLPDLFSSVDLLLLPYDFDGRSFDFIRLSMPTKVTEYMASGTPILIVAPIDCALSHLAIKSQFAHIVTTTSFSDLRDNLLFVLENKELRDFYRSNAISLVNSTFEIKKVQSAFLEIF